MTTLDDGETPSAESTGAIPPPKLCGRPTRSGRPCRQRIVDPRFDLSCRAHATDVEIDLADARRTAYHDGYRDGQESNQKFARFRIEQLQAHIDRLESANKPPPRSTDAQGRQIVQVGQHAYVWGGPESLAVGDQVWLPENYVSRMRHAPGRYRGEVTALGTDYTGDLSLILDRA